MSIMSQCTLWTDEKSYSPHACSGAKQQPYTETNSIFQVPKLKQIQTKFSKSLLVPKVWKIVWPHRYLLCLCGQELNIIDPLLEPKWYAVRTPPAIRSLVLSSYFPNRLPGWAGTPVYVRLIWKCPCRLLRNDQTMATSDSSSSGLPCPAWVT